MTLKTVTGPSIRDALADARRLFGDDVVLLQSSPSVHGGAASVTVAFDLAPPASAAPAPARQTAPPAMPEPVAAAAPRSYGYAAARNARPTGAEPISAPAAPAPPAAPPAATAAEVAELRARLAELEAALSEVRATAPAPTPSRAPLVLVGPGGSGKTTLALRLAQAPHLVGATSAAVVIVAPDAERYIDPAPVFWGAGVPVAVVQSADEAREAMAAFADADLVLVDTPALPLRPERARPFVERLGAVLAPLADVEVHLVVDATRSRASLTPETVAALGLRPDALALTCLDEASPDAWRWAGHLDCPIHLLSSGTDLESLHAESAAEAPAPPPPVRPGYSDEELAAFFQTETTRPVEPEPSRPVAGSSRPAAPSDAVFSAVEFVPTHAFGRPAARTAVLA